MAIFTFTGATSVRMTSLNLSVLNRMAIDENQSARVHWIGGGIDFSLVGTGLQASVANGHLTGLTGAVTGLFTSATINTAEVSLSIYQLALDGAAFYSLYAAKDWHGMLDLMTSGRDEIHGAAAGDTLSGGAGGDMILGMQGADKLLGGTGNDSLYGGSGSDTLVGGMGDDKFVFDSAIGKSVDVITDFGQGDSIVLWRAFFADIGAADHFLHKFEIGAEATSAATRVIYNAATGDLSYDQDGSGTAHAAVVFAHLEAGLHLTYHDFTLTN